MSWAGADMVAVQVQEELFAAALSSGLMIVAGGGGERGDLQTYRGGEEGLNRIQPCASCPGIL